MMLILYTYCPFNVKITFRGELDFIQREESYWKASSKVSEQKQEINEKDKYASDPSPNEYIPLHIDTSIPYMNEYIYSLEKRYFEQQLKV